MLTVEELRKTDPSLDEYTDEQLEIVRRQMYELADIIFYDWLEKRNKKDIVPVTVG